LLLLTFLKLISALLLEYTASQRAVEFTFFDS